MRNKIYRALTWIEDHLEEDISSETPAREACMSEYHFRRMFLASCGMTPGRYIRRRKLTEAAKILSAGKGRILDIALQYGFQSQESFTRSFKRMFGQTPASYRGTYRENGVHQIVNFQPPVDANLFKHITTGDIKMEPEIKKHDAFFVVGLGKDFELGTGEGEKIGALWNEFNRRITGIPGLLATGRKDYGVCRGTLHNGYPENKFHYTAGTGFKERPQHVPAGMEIVDVAAGDYAVFIHRGPVTDMQTTNQFIWQIWLPNTPYVLRDAPDFEVYTDTFDAKTGCGDVQIWVPIQAA